MYKIKDQIKAHDERLCPYYPSFKNHYVKKLNKIQADHPQLISRVHGTQYSVIFDNLQHLSEMLSEVLQSAKRNSSSQRCAFAPIQTRPTNAQFVSASDDMWGGNGENL